MPRTDVAIYVPSAQGLYEAGRDVPVGGAERQTAYLAEALARSGLLVAHVVFEVDRLRPPPHPGIRVVQRRPPHGGGIRRALGDVVAVWRAVAEADARVYVVRMATPALATVGLFCRLRRRGLVFAGANDTDFTFESVVVRGGLRRRLYRLGVRLADLVVVQTAQQTALAETAFPGARVEEVPSFAAPAAKEPGAAREFLWVGRLVPEKRPLALLDLADALPDQRFRMVGWETGQTPPELAAEVRRRVARTPNVELAGGLPHEEVLALVGDAIAVVVTSGAEGMPNVVLEGWARGVPALTLDFDPDGRIGAEGCGIAAGGSFPAFVEGARTLATDPARREELGRRGREHLARRHGPDAVGGRWRALLLALAPGAPA